MIDRFLDESVDLLEFHDCILSQNLLEKKRDCRLQPTTRDCKLSEKWPTISIRYVS